MPFDFPANPTNGQYYNGFVYNAANSSWDSAYAPRAATIPISSPNYILNSDFSINQRGFTSIALASFGGGYGFDRWFANGNGGTATYTPQAFTVGATPGGYEATNFARITVSGQSAASDFASISQKVEDVRTLAGKTVTVSFWAKAASGTPKLAVEFAQNFGTGGSSEVDTYAGQVTLSTSWSRYTLTATIPNVSGKTIGSSSFVSLNTWVSAGSTFASRTGTLGTQANTFDFWGVQLEEGSAATDFRRNAPSLQAELAACQRYYEKSYNQGVTPGTVTALGAFTFYGTADASGNIVSPVRFAVPKRTSGFTLTVYSTAGTSNQADWSRNGASGYGVPILYRENEAMFHSYVNVGSAWAVCNSSIHWTCSAEL